MRENRTYGSEGGEGHNPSRPLSNNLLRLGDSFRARLLEINNLAISSGRRSQLLL